jgi:L-glyceraldehyde 3-phosphate reductase
LAQFSLAWALRGERLTSVLIGASRVSQIEENVATLSNLDFSQEELDRIDSILNAGN